MSASFASALGAARDAAAEQHYPQATLYVVATPIGNLADITLRALHVLQLADTLACEDTRHTQGMLRTYGIDKERSQFLAVHQHNEAESAQAVVARMQQGERVAYVSDAGTPGVSDPGARLVAAARAAHLRVMPLPGPSNITTAISACGMIPNGDNGFVFFGFLPTKATERTACIQRLRHEPRGIVLLEAPHRIHELAIALAALEERPVTLARELTKQFEEISTLPASALAAWLHAEPHRARGEFVVLVHPTTVTTDDTDSLRILRLLLEEVPLKSAVRLAATITGAPRNALYDHALALQKSLTASAPLEGND